MRRVTIAEMTKAALAVSLILSLAGCSQGQFASPSGTGLPIDGSAGPTGSAGPIASRSPGASTPAEESVPPIESGELVVWASEPVARALKPFADRFATDQGVTVTVEAFSEDLVPSFLTASNAGASPDLIAAPHQGPRTAPGRRGHPADHGWDGRGLRSDRDARADLRRAALRDPLLDGEPRSDHRHGPGRHLPGDDGGARGDGQGAGQGGQGLRHPGAPGRTERRRLPPLPLFASGGGSLFGTTPSGDPDPTAVTVDDRASIAAGKRIASLGAKGAKALKTSIDQATAIPSFFGRQTAFLVSGPWAVPDIAKAAVPMAVCPIPPWRAARQPVRWST